MQAAGGMDEATASLLSLEVGGCDAAPPSEYPEQPRDGLLLATRPLFQNRRRKVALVGFVLMAAAVMSMAVIVPLSSGKSSPAAAMLSKDAAQHLPHAMGTTENKAHEAFDLVKESFLEGYNFTARLFRHKETGAEVFSITAPDVNKAGAVVFRTPVTDDKGAPHVLEHGLLGGSKKYPAKAPPTFDRMGEQSLATFLNAETYNDRTLFPVSSTNLQDFYNLMDVYMDALFNPLVLEDDRIFKQEAWHYRLEDADRPEDLSIVGVVLNEMTGAMSDANRAVQRAINQALYPNNTYNFESGGMPLEVPQLSHEEVCQFYRDLYHPSNARFWFYGDDPVVQRLQIVDDVIRGRGDQPEAREASRVAPQELFDAPRSFVGEYPGESQGKAYAVVAWVLSNGTEGLSPVEELGFRVLQDLLLGHATSPMQAALTNLDIGGRVWADSGLNEEEEMQPSFKLGMSGIHDFSVKKVHEKIFETLQDLADLGFEEEDVAASLNRIKNKMKRAPVEADVWGVRLLESMAGKWVWERDLMEAMRWDVHAEEVEAKVFGPSEGDAGLLVKLILEKLLNNPHCVNVTMVSSPKAAEEKVKAEEEALEKVKAMYPAGSSAAIGLVADVANLTSWQTTPDSPEAEAAVPVLSLEEVEHGLPLWARAGEITEPYPGTTLLELEEHTSGLLYANLGLDLGSSVPPEDVKLLPLLTFAFDTFAFKGSTKRERERDEFTNTCGIQYQIVTRPRVGAPDFPVFYLLIEGISTAEQAPHLLKLMRMALLNIELDSAEAEDAMRRHIDSTIRQMQSNFQENALAWVKRHTGAMMTSTGYLHSQLEGLVQLESLISLKQQLEEPHGWHGLRLQLEKLLTRLPFQYGTVLSLSGDRSVLNAARGPVEELLERLRPMPQPEPPAARRWSERTQYGNHALLVAPGSNNNIAIQAPVQLDGSVLPALQLLNRQLLIRVRMEGGAYGSYAELDEEAGILELSSYRDPNLSKTLETFHEAPDLLRQTAKRLTPEKMKLAIIGGLRELDPYAPASARGHKALMRFLCNVTDDARQGRLNELFSASSSDVNVLADAIEKATFVTVAAAPEEDAFKAQKEDGSPLFDEYISVEEYFAGL